MRRWIWVSLPYATFGIAVENGVVVEAAPIARKSVGRGEQEVAAFYRKQGAVFRDLPDVPCRAWIQPEDDGWGSVRVVRAWLEKLGYVTHELRLAGRVLLRVSGTALERTEALRMPGKG